MSKKTAYQNKSLIAYIDLILGDNATSESRIEAVDMLITDWNLEDSIASNLREMVKWLDDENTDVSDLFSIYFALASICPDYTMSYLEMGVPFLNPKTGQMEFRKATVAIVLDPVDTSEDIDAANMEESIMHHDFGANIIPTNKRLH